MCCGQKRAALSTSTTYTTTQATTQTMTATAPARSPNSAVRQGTASASQLSGRTNASPATAAAVPGSTPWAGPIQNAYGSVRLRYMETSPIRVQGPISGRQYDFSASQPVQAVDPRDAAPLLRTRFFQQTR